jgi:hypothetical protein
MRELLKMIINSYNKITEIKITKKIKRVGKLPMKNYKKLKPGSTVEGDLFSANLTPSKKILLNLYPASMRDKDKLRFLKVCRFIEENCSEYLRYMKKSSSLLYRGSRDIDPKTVYFIGASRLNRRPLDTPKKIQKNVDELLSLGGCKAIRSNSIFCISNSLGADGYGHIFCIFPCDGFSYTWSKHEDWEISVDDIIDSNIEFKKLLTLLRSFSVAFPDFSELSRTDGRIIESIEEYWSDARFFDAYDTADVLASMNKELLKIKTTLDTYCKIAKKYKLNSISSANIKTAYKLIMQASDRKQQSNNFLKYHNIRTNNLDQAMKTRNEVCICGHYVAIRQDILEINYDKLLCKYFGLKK